MTIRCVTLQKRNNRRDGVSHHQSHHCLLNRFFRHRSKKTSKLRVTGLCAGNSPVTGEFPAQMASDTESVSIWWRHRESESWYSILLVLQLFTGALLKYSQWDMFGHHKNVWSVKTSTNCLFCKTFLSICLSLLSALHLLAHHRLVIWYLNAVMKIGQSLRIYLKYEYLFIILGIGMICNDWSLGKSFQTGTYSIVLIHGWNVFTLFFTVNDDNHRVIPSCRQCTRGVMAPAWDVHKVIHYQASFREYLHIKLSQGRKRSILLGIFLLFNWHN